MKRTPLLLLTLVLLAPVINAEVELNDLDEIKRLRNTGHYEQALEKHISFHEESRTSPGMAGVRLSFALDAWIELSEIYPPALDALIKIRDDNKNMLLEGKGNFENFHDLYSINRELEKDTESYDLFLIIDKKYPDQAEDYYHVIEDLLIKRKEYEICGKYIGDPIYKYERLRHFREVQLSFTRKNTKFNNPIHRKFTDNSFIDGVVNLIEVLVAIERLDEARLIQKRALYYLDDDKIRYAIK